MRKLKGLPSVIFAASAVSFHLVVTPRVDSPGLCDLCVYCFYDANLVYVIIVDLVALHQRWTFPRYYAASALSRQSGVFASDCALLLTCAQACCCLSRSYEATARNSCLTQFRFCKCTECNRFHNGVLLER